MVSVGISHKTRHWQHYCFSHPPEGYRYVRSPDMPWHVAGINWEFLANTKFFLPFPRPDLYHTYNGIVGNRHPWVVEVESYLPRYQHMDPASRLYKWALRRLADDHCKGIIFTSQKAMELNRDGLVANGVDPAKMQVVYRAVEQHPAKSHDGRPFTILFAGNGFYRKGGVELLKAFLALERRDARLEIISRLEVDWGLCPLPDVQAWVERTVAGDPRITWHRDLPHRDVVGRMQLADLFVGATYLDPFNNTVLEAMGTGLPVIASDTGALPEVVVDGRNGWVLRMGGRSGDDIAEELAMRITQLMDDADLRRRMGEASQAIVRGKFTLHVRNAALAKIYGAALGAR
ncbi:MAG: glycosyltransferase family 4 protein [Flavobacteriia bacterium]|nr:glycosyltransferase family 4 protein [Flavobacteriia bacterium]